MIGYDWPDGRRAGVVVWDEGPYIFYNWILGREPEEDDYRILYMSNVIDQHTMVFTPEKLRKLYTEEEIRRNPDIMPMYGYRQKDVDRLRGDCEKNGEIIVIPAFSAPQNCDDADDVSSDPETRHFCEAMER